MPYAVLEKKINDIPQNYFGEISEFLDYIAFKASRSVNAVRKPRVGVAKGKFSVPVEFDSWDAEIQSSFGDDL